VQVFKLLVIGKKAGRVGGCEVLSIFVGLERDRRGGKLNFDQIEVCKWNV
jgi:hypothetical protein